MYRRSATLYVNPWLRHHNIFYSTIANALCTEFSLPQYAEEECNTTVSFTYPSTTNSQGFRSIGIYPNKWQMYGFWLDWYASSRALREGKAIHAHLLRTKSCLNAFVGTKLIKFYSNCGAVASARTVFNLLKKQNRNQILWNSMLAAYALHGLCNEALELYCQMQSPEIGMQPDEFTFPFILKACAQISLVQHGRAVHVKIIKLGLDGNVYVASALVDVYAKCGVLKDARQVFDKILDKNVVSWTAIISGCSQNENWHDALNLFSEMVLDSCVVPNAITVASVAPAIAQIGTLRLCGEIHGYVIPRELQRHVFVANALLDAYAKLGSVDSAKAIFSALPRRDLVSYNAMIAGYVQGGFHYAALELFHEMLRENLRFDAITISSALKACAYLATLQQGKSLHTATVKFGQETFPSVGNALIDMYAKCGSIELAFQVFKSMSERDVVSWTAIVCGFALHGLSEDALQLFDEMQCHGCKPNAITLVGVLSACRHSGLVERGLWYFRSMKTFYELQPGMKHYACIVDLLGRSGRLEEACKFIKNMPMDADASVLGSLLSACKLYRNTEIAAWAADMLMELNVEDVSLLVLIANLYADAGKWTDVARIRLMIKKKGAKKNPGCSWIEINSCVYTFYVGSQCHSQAEMTFAKL